MNFLSEMLLFPETTNIDNITYHEQKIINIWRHFFDVFNFYLVTTEIIREIFKVGDQNIT